jgi:hypothetical protein
MVFVLSLPVLGLFAGVMLWSRLAYVAIAIADALGHADTASQLRNPTDVQFSKFLAVFAGSSCVWLLVFGGLVAHFALAVPSATGWALFFGGIAATPIAIGLTTARAVRRLRQHRATGTQP